MGYLTLSGHDDDAVFVGEYTRLGDDAKKEALKQSRAAQAGGDGDDGIPTSLIIMGGAAMGLIGMVLLHARKTRKNPGRGRRRRRNPRTKKVAVAVHVRGKTHNIFVDLPVSPDGKVRLTDAERRRIAKLAGAGEQDVVAIR